MSNNIILESNILMADLGNIEIISPEDDKTSVQEKINNLQQRAIWQLNQMKIWFEQEALLSPSESEELLSPPSMITAYFIDNRFIK